ncbi:hypothetical protein DFA_02686 [Cavenderia fasciculata]|uniref:Uncharacterized protein n=1 Tax=Cavenderia fasciculata TaxID=261658 RepID=F4Q032_CACFS|nr:uncharacterized protein DFA_02686 [Cavenderia fasciculata]EGG18946.1 hypothetical protein DFA_02686 [Cavenderia fasciculata]|eukprot:XP_004357408.1 hypothetical protein DFA_02686 [Cavenderia fasciculata]
MNNYNHHNHNNDAMNISDIKFGGVHIRILMEIEITYGKQCEKKFDENGMEHTNEPKRIKRDKKVHVHIIKQKQVFLLRISNGFIEKSDNNSILNLVVMVILEVISQKTHTIDYIYVSDHEFYDQFQDKKDFKFLSDSPHQVEDLMRYIGINLNLHPKETIEVNPIVGFKKLSVGKYKRNLPLQFIEIQDSDGIICSNIVYKNNDSVYLIGSSPFKPFNALSRIIELAESLSTNYPLITHRFEFGYNTTASTIFATNLKNLLEKGCSTQFDVIRSYFIYIHSTVLGIQAQGLEFDEDIEMSTSTTSTSTTSTSTSSTSTNSKRIIDDEEEQEPLDINRSNKKTKRSSKPKN